MRILGVWLMAALCLLAGPVLAKDVHVIGFEVPQLLPLEGDGPYTRVMDALGRRAKGQSFAFTRSPVRRAIRDLVSDTPIADCIFPTDVRNVADMGLDANDFLQSDPVNFARVHVFTAPGLPKITHMDQLHGMSVAFTEGYGFGPTLTPLITGEQTVLGHRIPVSSSVQSMRLLLKYKRVDAVIGYLPEDVLVAKALGLPRPNFDPDNSFFEVAERIVCHRNPRNRAFLQAINGALDAQRRSGELSRILGTAYIEPTSKPYVN